MGLVAMLKWTRNWQYGCLLITARLMLGAVVGGFLLGTWTLTRVPRRYESSASIVFPITTDDRLGGSAGLLRNLASAGTEVPFGSQFPINTYRAVLLSRTSLESAARAVGIPQRYHLSTQAEIIGFMTGVVTVDVSTDRMLIVNVRLPGTPRIKSLGDLTVPGQAAQRDADVRRMLPTLANTVISQMGQIADDMKLDSAKVTVDSLRKKLGDLKEQRDRLLALIVATQESVDAPDAVAMAQELASAIVSYEGSISQLSSEIEGLQRQRQVSQSQVASALDHLPSLSGDVPLLQEQRSVYVEAKRKFDELARMYGPENAELLKAKGAMVAAKTALDEASVVARKGYTQNVMYLDGQLANLMGKKRVAESYLRLLRERTRKLPFHLMTLATDRAEAEALAQRIADLAQQLQRAEVNYETQGIRWRVLDVPLEPQRKSAPSSVKMILLGALLGMVVLNLSLLGTAYHRLIAMLAGDVSDDGGEASA